jgi:hypothetical protein
MSDSFEPYRMNDGRGFTDYRPSHETNNDLKLQLCNSDNKCCNTTSNDYKYKLCLINNTDTIKKQMESNNFKNHY